MNSHVTFLSEFSTFFSIPNVESSSAAQFFYSIANETHIRSSRCEAVSGERALRNHKISVCSMGATFATLSLCVVVFPSLSTLCFALYHRRLGSRLPYVAEVDAPRTLGGRGKALR